MRSSWNGCEQEQLSEAIRQFVRRAVVLAQREATGVVPADRCLDELRELWSALEAAGKAGGEAAAAGLR